MKGQAAIVLMHPERPSGSNSSLNDATKTVDSAELMMQGVG